MKRTFKILAFISIFLCMIIIYMFSSQKSAETTQISIKVTRKILSFMFGNYQYQSDEIKSYMISDMHYTIRKLAHFTLYYGLSAVIYLALYFNKLNYKKCFVLSVGVSLIYAISDEFHQFYVDGRTAKITDVFIDGMGAVFGSVTIFAVIACISYIKYNKDDR